MPVGAATVDETIIFEGMDRVREGSTRGRGDSRSEAFVARTGSGLR